MLVLSRKQLEKIVIDVPPSDRPRRIVVSVVVIERGKVRLGFEAGRDIRVMRPELLQQPPKPRTMIGA
jgi:carbon storage regulator CsrA